jgi:hypothetical protein
VTRPARAVAFAAAAVVASACHAGTGADPGLIASALARPGVGWSQHDVEHFRLYAVEGSYAAAHLPALGAAAERARTHDLELLGDPVYPRRVTLLFVPTREAMRSFVGWPAGGWGVAAENGAFFVASDSLSPALRHELMHVFSWNQWGTPFGGPGGGQWISEGLATYAVGGCQDIGVHTLAATYAGTGQLLPWTDLATRFDVRTLASYAQAGSIVAFVRERFGDAGLRRLWRDGLPGLEAATGISVDRLERLWRAVLAAAPPTARPEDGRSLAARVRRQGCERT